MAALINHVLKSSIGLKKEYVKAMLNIFPFLKTGA